MPRISVVLLLDHRDAEVGEAIDSVLAQTIEDFEVVVVDRDTTEKNRKIVRRYGDLVRFVERASFAHLTDVLSGELIAFAGPDDVLLPFRLAAETVALDRSPEAALVFSDLESYVRGQVIAESHLRASVPDFDNAIKHAFSSVSTCRALELPVPRDLLDRNVYRGQVAPLIVEKHVAFGSTLLVRTRVLRELGGDWEMSAQHAYRRLAAYVAKDHELVYLDLPTVLYREVAQDPDREELATQRELLMRAWRSDPLAYEQHKEVIDLSLGTAWAQLGELEAEAGNWRAAEEAFRRAVLAWPRLTTAYPNLALAALRSRLPGLLSKMLPKRVRSRDSDS